MFLGPRPPHQPTNVTTGRSEFASAWRWNNNVDGLGGKGRVYSGDDSELNGSANGGHAAYITYVVDNGTTRPDKLMKWNGAYAEVPGLSFTRFGHSAEMNADTFTLNVNGQSVDYAASGIVRNQDSTERNDAGAAVVRTNHVLIDKGNDLGMVFATLAEFVGKGYQFEFNQSGTSILRVKDKNNNVVLDNLNPNPAGNAMVTGVQLSTSGGTVPIGAITYSYVYNSSDKTFILTPPNDSDPTHQITIDAGDNSTQIAASIQTYSWNGRKFLGKSNC